MGERTASRVVSSGAAPPLQTYGDGAARTSARSPNQRSSASLYGQRARVLRIVLVARDHTFRAGELHRIPQEKIDAQHRVGALAALRRLCGAQQKPRAPVRSQLLILISACTA